jgi:[glutamine synthetase] adenylyltransferase / [glutamine synthetase]-adenylyl-L-tyrosine phosphorylase
MPGGARHAPSLGLRDVVAPFVYRRYLDYGVFEALRQLHQKVRDEAARRAAGRPDRANDVKLSRGGIREIEFTVQLLQVVRGGQFPEIRTRSTLKALKRLAHRGLIKTDVAQRLANSYVLLRQIEHRIQYLDDQQTHLLPRDDQDLQWIAASLGLTDHTATDPDCRSGACQLMTALCQVREFVANEFDSLLHDGRTPPASECKGCGTQYPVDSPAFIDKLPPAMAERVQAFASQSRVALMPDAGKLRLARLLGRACQLSLQVATDAPSEDAPAPAPLGEEAVFRFIDWLTPLLRRDSYLSLLAERPEVLQRLLRLLGLARWPMRYLMKYPGVIDELADPRLMEGRFNRDDYLQELTARYQAWVKAGEASEEALLDALRRAHHAEMFRILVRDVDGLISVEEVADDLSALADATVNIACQWAWAHLQARPGKQGLWAVNHAPRLGVIAYGKLGGKELGYGSDLDLVFLYEVDEDASSADGPDAPDPVDAYLVFARKLITWLTLHTPSGELFDIDMALRPNGNSGLLVTSVDAFDNYQRQRGSNTAWTWEHQALSRARWCAGDQRMQAHFEDTRRAVLSTQRNPDALREEIQSMRGRLRQAHPAEADSFDLKHGTGGMIDIEFAVQYLVLAHSHAHPELMDNVGNIALLGRSEAAGLLPPEVGAHAAQAYRAFRRLQHRARLDEAPTTLTGEALKEQRSHIMAGLTLWHQVFP